MGSYRYKSRILHPGLTGRNGNRLTRRRDIDISKEETEEIKDLYEQYKNNPEQIKTDYKPKGYEETDIQYSNRMNRNLLIRKMRMKYGLDKEEGIE